MLVMWETLVMVHPKTCILDCGQPRILVFFAAGWLVCCCDCFVVVVVIVCFVVGFVWFYYNDCL